MVHLALWDEDGNMTHDEELQTDADVEKWWRVQRVDPMADLRIDVCELTGTTQYTATRPSGSRTVLTFGKGE